MRRVQERPVIYMRSKQDSLGVFISSRTHVEVIYRQAMTSNQESVNRIYDGMRINISQAVCRMTAPDASCGH